MSLTIYDGVDGKGYFRVGTLDFGEAFFVMAQPFQPGDHKVWIIPIFHGTKLVAGHLCVSLETFHSCIKEAEQ